MDKRADIWAFGAVLFEMLTGQRAFPGEDLTDTLAAVVKLEPKWDALGADVPASVRQVLRVCLQKDPKQRAQAIGDVRLALEGAFETLVPLAAAAPSRRRWDRAGWTVAAMASVAAIGFAVAALRASPTGIDARIHPLHAAAADHCRVHSWSNRDVRTQSRPVPGWQASRLRGTQGPGWNRSYGCAPSTPWTPGL